MVNFSGFTSMPMPVVTPQPSRHTFSRGAYGVAHGHGGDTEVNLHHDGAFLVAQHSWEQALGIGA